MGMLDVEWKGLILPLAYVIVLGSALMTFSRVYRKRKAGMYSLAFQMAPHSSWVTAI